MSDAAESGHGALIWCPFGDEGSATRVAEALLDEGLVACVNIVPGMRSLYVWNGERGGGSEAGALFKTREELRGAAIARIEALHPYAAPAILGWRCDAASAGTLAWLGQLAG